MLKSKLEHFSLETLDTYKKMGYIYDIDKNQKKVTIKDKVSTAHITSSSFARLLGKTLIYLDAN